MNTQLTIRSSRDRFAAAALFGKLSQRRGRKALRLNSGVMRHMKKSSLRDLTEAALENAKMLLQEASLLHEQQHHSRAYFLAVASIEETGKAAIAHDAQGRNLQDQAVRSKVERMLTDHASKIRSAFVGFLTADPRKNAEPAVALIVQLQRGREPSMYTEMRQDGTIYKPADSVSHSNSLDCIRLADRCWKSVENHVHNTTPRTSSAIEDRFFALKSGESSKIMGRSDFWWYHISRMEAGQKDLAESVISYRHNYLLAGREFEREDPGGAA